MLVSLFKYWLLMIIIIINFVFLKIGKINILYDNKMVDWRRDFVGDESLLNFLFCREGEERNWRVIDFRRVIYILSLVCMLKMERNYLKSRI